MRRFLRLPAGARFLWLATFAYFVLRGAASWGRPVAIFPDTAGYESLVFRGSNARFWPVPLAFHVVSGAGARVLLHVLVGTVAWTGFAAIASRRTRWPRAVTIVILAIGLTPQVVRWDLALLSESLGISFTIAAVAATLWMAADPSVASRLSWFIAVVLCAFTRPTHLVVLLACAAGAVVVAVSSRGRRMLVATVVLVTASAWGWMLLVGNRSTSELNLYTILAERVATNDGRYSWFTGHGMPDIPGVREAEGYDFAGELPAELATFVGLPVGQQPPAIIRAGGLPLASWVRSHGWRVYGRYVVTHAGDSWSRISSLAAPTLDPPNDDFLPLDSRSVMPRAMFRSWWLWSVAGIAAIAAGAARPGGGRVVRALVAMACTTSAVFAVTVLCSGIEHQRHAATVAVLVRVITLAAFANLTVTGGRRLADDGDRRADFAD